MFFTGSLTGSESEIHRFDQPTEVILLVCLLKDEKDASIIVTKEDATVKLEHIEFERNMGNEAIICSLKNEFIFRPAETNSQKSNLRKAIAKKWEIKKPEGHDGFCPLLRIYRPRTSMKKKDELENLPAKVRRFKWVRDPISDQWIHVERIGEDARAA